MQLQKRSDDDEYNARNSTQYLYGDLVVKHRCSRQFSAKQKRSGAPAVFNTNVFNDIDIDTGNFQCGLKFR